MNATTFPCANGARFFVDGATDAFFDRNVMVTLSLPSLGRIVLTLEPDIAEQLGAALKTHAREGGAA